jgi:hypothetical protein
MAFYFDNGASGPDYAACDRMCIASALPVGLIKTVVPCGWIPAIIRKLLDDAWRKAERRLVEEKKAFWDPVWHRKRLNSPRVTILFIG